MTPQTTGPKYATTTTTANADGIDGDWINPTNIFLDDGSVAQSSFFNTIFQTAPLVGQGFGFAIPSNAVIDGIKLEFEVTSSNRWSESNGTVQLMKAGSNVGTNKAGTGVNASGIWSYGGAEDLWGTTWTPAEINAANFGASGVFGMTSSPNDFLIAIDFYRITVFWHYDVTVSPADVPIRHLYKVYTNDNRYLGNLPKVITPFGFGDEMNASGAQITVECGVSMEHKRLESDYIITEAGDRITDEAGNYLKTEGQPSPITVGSDTNSNALFKNGNRIVVWEYNYYYPNGKAMFAGQVNKVQASSAGDTIKLLVNSDGLDLDNYTARGYPFAYTNDQSQNSQNASVTVRDYGGAGWDRYGQTFIIGVGVTNIGAITLYLNGIADVTISVYNGYGGSLLGSATKSVNTAGAAAAIQFALASLIDGASGGTYFMTVSVGSGQSILLYYSNANPYSNGQMYSANYGGGSGGGSYSPVVGSDLYFITASGTATTTATYSTTDPSTGMLSPIMLDYNNRGGRVVERDFDATGLSLTYTFNTNTVFDAAKACLSMSPNGFYFRVDLGTSELDFLQANTEADFTLIKGRHLNDIDLVLSIENLKNQMLFSGGESAGVNLYKSYENQDSIDLYGPRLERKSDNRVTVGTTADAIGDSFIDENSEEQNYTQVQISYKTMDLSLLVPGKTIGFAGFGSFIDSFVLQIARREYASEVAILDLGMLPPRMSPLIEQITRGLIAEQTVANPSAPS